LITAGAMASIGVLGSHFAGDFFLGIDIMVTSMLVNFLLMCLTVLTLPKVNSTLAQEIAVFKHRGVQRFIGITGIISISGFLVIHVFKDLNQQDIPWYFHSTYIWLIVMLLGSVLYTVSYLRSRSMRAEDHFKSLPSE